jgi:hypothetical protein
MQTEQRVELVSAHGRAVAVEAPPAAAVSRAVEQAQVREVPGTLVRPTPVRAVAAAAPPAGQVEQAGRGLS